jgi:hypothetical protein
VAFLSVWAWVTLGGEPGVERAGVTFRLVDGATGAPTPAMVCIRDCDDGAVRLPPDGDVCRRVSQTRDFYTGVRFRSADRAWIGPVRKTMGRGDNNDRSYAYEDRPSLPYWREPVMYQTRSDFSITLPPGRYRLAVSHGMEYVPVSYEFTVTAGRFEDRTVALRRWVNLPALGWWSGDVHVHHPTVEEAHRAFLLRYAAAEDLNVVNVLEMGHHKGTEFKQQGFGKEYRVRRGNYCLVAGQEEPRSTFGHIIGLNMASLARDVATYDFYDLAFDRIHAQPGALAGFAHFAWNGCALPRGFPWYVTTGDLDFVELLQFNTWNATDYDRYLNLGFRLTAAAGSDVPWGSTIGEVRTYVYAGPKLDLDAWFAGLKKGHTFVSNGPALLFTVDGKLPGSEIRAEPGDRLRIRARAWGHEKVGTPDRLVIAGTYGAVKEESTPAAGRKDGVTERACDFEHTVRQSTWLSARVTCANGAMAHTSPVYVIVVGRPPWNPVEGPAIIRDRLEGIAKIEREFAAGTDARSKGIRERLKRARAFYAALAAKMAAAR